MSERAIPHCDLQSVLWRITARWRETAQGTLDRLRFLGAWLRNPVRTAAIMPSGAALSALITAEVDARTGAVLELGGGTGAFTAALIARGVAESDITIVEQDEAFAALLAQRYPRSTVLAIDATDLHHVARDDRPIYGAAICGLGLLNMPPDKVEAILRATFARLHHHGALYLFTYGRRCSVPDAVLARLGLEAEYIGLTLRNLPPASVFRIERRIKSVAFAVVAAQ